MSVRRSLVWTYASQATAFFVTFASTVVVARLVSPRDFGIYAMAVAITTVINVFMQFGLSKYIMREAEISRDLLRSLFTVNLLMTILYVIAILIGAAAAHHLFASRELGQFLLIFALFPLIAMMEFIPSALCARDMRFGVISSLAVVRAVVLASSTIALAMLGFAYLSFAWAQVLTSAISAIAFNVALWRPDVWKPRLVGIRAILHFGVQMIGVSGISQLNTRIGEMTLGSLLGLGNLGLYSRASSLPTTLSGNVLAAGSNVVFSRLSSEVRASGEFHETYLRFMRLLLGMLWPMMIGIAVLAQPIIAILYGAKWQAAAIPLAILTIAAAVSVTMGLAAEIFVLRHQTSRQLRIETLRAIFGYAAFAAGATVSLTLAAAAKLAEAVFAFLLYRKPMIDLVGGAPSGLRGVYLEGLLVTLAAVAPALLLMLWSSWSPSTPPLHLSMAILIGVVCWAVLLVRLQHPIYHEGSRFFQRTR
jgi:O-antigen/teichoic acid export membrane protein